ncbi:MAG: hypothetical protein HWN80_18080 [Candidatus Lokiarchaeota archaeon]|nr:hypothetical protein [Candidatus Lokiarchaeota archaeon]
MDMTKCMRCGKEFNMRETQYRVTVCSEDCYKEWREDQMGTGVIKKNKKVWYLQMGCIELYCCIIVLILGAFFIYLSQPWTWW